MKAQLCVLLGLMAAGPASTARAGSPQDRPGDKPATAAPAPAPAIPTGDEGQIRAEVAAFVDAFRRGDAKALAALFAEEGEAVDAKGGAIRGRRAIEGHYAARFAESPGESIEAAIDSIKPLAPGVASEAGTTRLVPAAGGPPILGRYSAIRVKQDGRWLLASARELPEPEPDHQEHLKELAWLVGDWVEETGDSVILTSLAWTEDRNFLLRNFEVRVAGKPALKGTQRIGWDPITRQIKSWVFDSTGGYGDGLWMRSGDRWIVKATGVRPDGLTATMTQVLTRESNHRLRWKSTDRTLGGEAEQDGREVVMVRKPPEPR